MTGTERNLEIVRRSIDAINAGDLDAVMACFTEDVIFDGTRIMEGTVEGKDPYRGFLETVIDSVDVDYTNVSYLTEGDRVVALADVIGSGLASGVPVEGRVAFLYELRAGLICRQEVHPEVEALLRSLGIEE